MYNICGIPMWFCDFVKAFLLELLCSLDERSIGPALSYTGKKTVNKAAGLFYKMKS